MRARFHCWNIAISFVGHSYCTKHIVNSSRALCRVDHEHQSLSTSDHCTLLCLSWAGLVQQQLQVRIDLFSQITADSFGWSTPLEVTGASVFFLLSPDRAFGTCWSCVSGQSLFWLKDRLNAWAQRLGNSLESTRTPSLYSPGDTTQWYDLHERILSQLMILKCM